MAAHDHDHDHGHRHGSGDADHHGHAHDPAAVAIPGFSLLRLSALDRLAGSLVLSGAIWLGVWWALR